MKGFNLNELMSLLCLSLFGSNNVEGKTRYFLDDFAGQATPFPFDQCILGDDGLSRVYTCNDDGDEVTETTYSDTVCGTSSGTPQIYDTNSGVEFDCFGVDSYVKLEIGVDYLTLSCFAIGFTPIAIDLCYDAGSGIYGMVTCTDDDYTVTTYTDNLCTTPVPAGSITSGACTSIGDIDTSAYGTVTGTTSVSSCVKGQTPAPTEFKSTSEPMEPATTEGDNTPVVTDTVTDTPVDPTEPADPTVPSNPATTETPVVVTQVADVDTTAVSVVDSVSNYVFASYIGAFNVPFPLNVCVQTELGSPVGVAEYKYFTCDEDGLGVTSYSYSQDDCDVSSKDTSSETSYTTNFECNGDDSYASLIVSAEFITECQLPFGSLYAALNVCFEVDGLYSAAECDGTTGDIVLNYYADSDCTILEDVDTITSCTDFTSVEEGSTTYNIQIQPGVCVIDDTESDDEPKEVTDTPQVTDSPDTIEPEETDDPNTPQETDDSGNDTNDPVETDIPDSPESEEPVVTYESVDLTSYHSNYIFNNYLDQISIPFPIGVCVQTGLDGTNFNGLIEGDEFPYTTFSCEDDGTRVSATTYSTSTCDSTSVGKEYYLTAENATFVCHDQDDYASLDVFIGFGSNQCALGAGTLYAAVGVCFEVELSEEAGGDSYYAAVTCDADTGDITLNSFDDEDCTIVSEVAEINGCTYFITVDVDGTEYDISYQPGECERDDVTTSSPNETGTSADESVEESSSAMIGNLLKSIVIIAVFVASVVIGV